MTSRDRGLWIGVVLGGPILVLGVLDVVGDARRTHPGELAWWVVGSAVVLDLVVVPLALGVGRVVRGAAWRWALAATATLVVVGWPYIRGYGRRPDNPSLLVRDYGTGVAVAVAVVWTAAVLLVVVSRRRASRTGSPGAGAPQALP